MGVSAILRSDIEQAADQDSSRMQARLKYIPIEQLVHYAGKKVSSLLLPSHCNPLHGIKLAHFFPALCVTLHRCSPQMFAIDAHLCDVFTKQAAAQPLPPQCCVSQCMKATVRELQVLVDVLGVVTNVGPMRSIKRKQDGTEFFCRDVTIADAGYTHFIASHLWYL